ncbi:hypothetical protein Nm8I071_05150 [Nonomuraea sp. TT08I-71]|nr:hypothetical protein Nm8I071_05150 [Nonomuraea sp. TT08I-71]
MGHQAHTVADQVGVPHVGAGQLQALPLGPDLPADVDPVARAQHHEPDREARHGRAVRAPNAGHEVGELEPDQPSVGQRHGLLPTGRDPVPEHRAVAEQLVRDATDQTDLRAVPVRLHGAAATTRHQPLRRRRCGRRQVGSGR